MKILPDGILSQSTAKLILCAGLLLLSLTANAIEKPKPGAAIEGHLSFTGSGALSNLMTYWTQAFAKRYPLITITIADPGGIAGMASLINASTDLALVSAPLSTEQKEAFTTRFGYAPHIIPVAMDAVAIYVNDANPLTSISLHDLDAIFSSTYRCGEAQPLQTWGALGVKGALAQLRISVYGLTIDTDANHLFRESVLCGGDYLKEFQALVGPDSVESALISDSASIAFSDNNMHTPGAHKLSLVLPKHASPVAASPTTIRSGLYPLRQTLAIAINQPTSQPLSTPLKTFIDFVFSPEGQNIVTKTGFVALH
jgi:phosphate transport system substrate-binding protein